MKKPCCEGEAAFNNPVCSEKMNDEGHNTKYQHFATYNASEQQAHADARYALLRELDAWREKIRRELRIYKQKYGIEPRSIYEHTKLG
jgi:hypothetical protein